MKKLLIACTLLGAMFLQSCKKEMFDVAEVNGNDAFVASVEHFENDADTKTSLSVKNAVVWSAGDQIAIFQGAPVVSRFEVDDACVGTSYGAFNPVQGNSSQGGGFTSVMEIPSNIAFYPYSDELDLEDVSVEEDDNSYTITNVTIPSQQRYLENSFPKGVFSMVAVTESAADKVLKFKNVLGAIKLQLLGDCAVKTIEVKGNKGEILSGRASVTAYKNSDAPAITMLEGGGKTITLNCGNGVQLNKNTATTFIIAVPPTHFIGGFTVSVTDINDNVMTIKSYVANRVLRSSMLKMSNVTIPVTDAETNIDFEDEKVKAMCVAAFDTDGDSELSFEEAAVVTSLDAMQVDKEITSFKELRYFTSLTKIKSFLFDGCENLSTIDFPEGVTSIGSAAFQFCRALTSIDIPEGVTEIGSFAFNGCNSLISINLPEGLTKIGEFTFTGCRLLSYVDIPHGVREIGESAFGRCASLTTIFVPEEVVKIGEKAFWACESLTTINIPDGVTKLGESVFKGCESLISLVVPADVTEIGKAAFESCESLASINIPDGVTKLEESVFKGCKSLITIEVPADVTEIGKAAFAGCESLASINIPDGVTKLEESVFSQCKSLTSITIPTGVTSIKYGAFYDCKSLTTINIPAGVIEIEDNAFYGCESLISITLPAGVTSIKFGAFWGCSSLESINLPAGLTKIEGFAFFGCTTLNRLCVKPTTPPAITNSTFYKCSTDIKFYVPQGSVDAYKAASGWSDYASVIFADTAIQ